MANKQVSQLNGGVLVDPLLADLLHIVQGGNSRPTDMSRVRSLIDGQNSRTLISRGNQGSMQLASAMFTPNLNSSTVQIASAIPARSLVLCATTRVLTDLSGTLTSFDVGYTGSTDAFGGTIGKTAGSTNVGVIAPQPFHSDTNMVLTANGGSGSANAGKIRIVLYYISWTAPTA